MTNTTRNNIIPMTTEATTTTSSSVHTEPGVSCDLRRILIAYNEVLGNMPSQVGHFLSDLMAEGMEADVIINAINDTAWAARPSPRYLRGILLRYQDDEIYTMTDLRLNQSRRDVKRRSDHHDREQQLEWWR